MQLQTSHRQSAHFLQHLLQGVLRLLHGGEQQLDLHVFCVASETDPLEKRIWHGGLSISAWKEKNPGVPRSGGRIPGECWNPFSYRASLKFSQKLQITTMNPISFKSLYN